MEKNENKFDEIEIIDIFDEEEDNKIDLKVEEAKKDKKEPETKTKKNNGGKKLKLKKTLFFQAVFCTLSILFVIGCCIYYGTRLVKYYKIYNPKDENGNAIALLGNHILNNSSFVYEGEGIYAINASNIYKGEKVDNYLKYSNLTWRILKINEDKSIDIVLDDSINSLKWNSSITEYSNSDINKYLNEVFLKNINKQLITTTNVCIDIIDELAKISCNKVDNKNYVRLLSVDEFLNSKVEDKTFISNSNNIWLSTRGTDKAWTINGTNLSYAEVTNTYNVKPVVTLKNSNQIVSGNGTKEEPYVIKEDLNEIKIADHIKLGDDIWTVYEVDKDTIRLSLSSIYKEGNTTYRFDLKDNKYNPENKSSLAKYLNTEYYESLSYKDLLLDEEWYIGEYNDSYEDIYTEKVKAKVGLSSVIDLKLDKNVNNYYLSNGTKENKIYLYNEELIESKVTLSRRIKPSICIKSSKTKSGSGTLTDPYVLEG